MLKPHPDALASNLPDLLEASAEVSISLNSKDLRQRLTGRFYTHERVGRAIAHDIVCHMDSHLDELSIIDPFCGDGRLVCWLLEELAKKNQLPSNRLKVSVWDCDSHAVTSAVESLQALQLPVSIEIDSRVVDSFTESLQAAASYDICVTNPPWETLKPDPRELSSLDEIAKEKYVSLLKSKIYRLDKAFPYSKATRSFSGWGANLARYGIEASLRLTKRNGIFAVIAPATIFGDQISARLRWWLFTVNAIPTLHYYPAEARLFGGVDQAAVYFLGEPSKAPPDTLKVVQHEAKSSGIQLPSFELSSDYLHAHDFAIGFNSTHKLTVALENLLHLPRLGDYERGQTQLVKMGRELDETGIVSKLCDEGKFQFIKGRQIKPFSFDHLPSIFLKDGIKVPSTVNEFRLAWRDVARQSSNKRMIATLLPPGIATGNSANILVAHGDDNLLKAVLAVFNSLVFEAQVRSSISTNHLSVGAVRKLRVPLLTNRHRSLDVATWVDAYIKEPSLDTLAHIDLAVFKWYGLALNAYESILSENESRVPELVLTIRNLLKSNEATHPNS